MMSGYTKQEKADSRCSVMKNLSPRMPDPRPLPRSRASSLSLQSSLPSEP